MVITSESIKHEIENGLTIVDNYITDEYDKNIANNIVKYSCEMYDGSGYPDSLKGDNIPIEASIVNMIVRIVSAQDILTGINSILEERTKYNPKLIDALNDAKNDLIGLN
jgi:response regulator RpfG family c-di-GMP phosphodiesterase